MCPPCSSGRLVHAFASEPFELCESHRLASEGGEQQVAREGFKRIYLHYNKSKVSSNPIAVQLQPESEPYQDPMDE